MNEAQREIVKQAIEILAAELQKPSSYITSPQVARDFLILQLAELEHEVFGVLHLNNQHGVIEFEIMFRGTIDGASVYPREVVKSALAKNAAAVVFAHNHPSGAAEPSQADRRITDRLVAALQMVEIRVLDHIIVGGTDSISFAEQGLL